MKSIASAVAIAAALAAPVLAHAQTNPPLTRAQVRADPIAVEQAGYRPSKDADPHYPDNVQAAERKVAEQRPANETGYGAGTNGTVQTGMRSDMTVSSYSPPIRVAR